MSHFVSAVDCRYIASEFAGVFVVLSDPDPARAEVALVETNTAHALPLVKERLQSLGVSPEQVRAVVVTHAHLDHAGGVGTAMKEFTNAKLYAHPRAARHLIDPSRLVASARGVYGDEVFRELYGEILPVDAARVQIVQDGETVRFGGGEWFFRHVRGHANHHFVLFDPAAQAVFTGDSFGLAYPSLQGKNRQLFVLPSSSPTDFDPAAAIESVHLIVTEAKKLGCNRACLTHFGEVSDLEGAEQQLVADLQFYQRLLLAVRQGSLPSEDAASAVRLRLDDYYRERCEREGLEWGEKEWATLDLDLKLNAQGIVWSAQKSETSEQTSRG